MLEKLYAFFFLAIFCTAVSLVGYWELLQDDHIITGIKTINTIPVKIEAGKTLYVTRYFCLNKAIPGTVQRHFSNHLIHQLPTTSTVSQNLGCRERTYHIDIPAGLYPGEYVYNVRLVYELNPIRKVTYELPPIPLVITNKAFKQ